MLMQTDVKLYPIRSNRCGGNRMPQTFRHCFECNILFGPLDYLSRKFCSYSCKIKAQTTGRLTFRKTLKFARSAQSLLAYQIKVGNITRPMFCEKCKNGGIKIEAAHKDYSRPLDVQWLCRSCHVRLDKKNPKNVTVAVSGKM